MDEIILIGSGGHTKACIDAIECENRFKIAGLVEREKHVGHNVFGYPIIGTDNDLKDLVKKYQYAFITVGQTRDSKIREAIHYRVKECGFILPNIVAPSSYVSKHAIIGSGSIVLHNAVVNADAKIGTNCIINNCALIEHDVTIQDHCHISTGAIINGHSKIGTGTLIGSSAVVNQCVEIPSNCIVGSSTVVLHSLTESGTYVGFPLRKIDQV
jgi:sugar O-acyltransferase (sialic acid O-acetyltransferase NeuD family)